MNREKIGIVVMEAKEREGWNAFEETAIDRKGCGEVIDSTYRQYGKSIVSFGGCKSIDAQFIAKAPRAILALAAENDAQAEIIKELRQEIENLEILCRQLSGEEDVIVHIKPNAENILG